MEPDITIRKLSLDDGKLIPDCIIEARGRRYYSEKYYTPDYLTGSDEHELFAAYDAHGKLAGITGISRGLFDNSRTTLSLLNIRPDYAGQGIATRLLKHSVNTLRERGVKAIKGNVVTRHMAIQGVLEGIGLIPTGFLHGVRDGMNAEPPVNGKCTLTVHVCNVSVNEIGVLYLHDAIAELAKTMYADMGVTINQAHSGQYSQTSVIEHYYDDHDSVLFIHILECGSDIAEILNMLRKKFESAPSMTVIVLLNLGSPSATSGFGALCSAGWRFCGFDPLGRHENAIFFGGYPILAEMKMTERTGALYERLNQ